MDPSDHTNLIVNYLPQPMNQEELRSLFSTIGPVKSCKLIRNKTTGQSLAFGFVDYENPLDAEKAIQTLNGLVMQNKTLKVSYARPSSNAIKNANLYISGLPPTFTQEALDEMFSPYGHIITSKVVIDNDTGTGKGIAFVRFDKNSQAVDAITGLNQSTPAGCPGPITVKYANPPKSAQGQGQGQAQAHAGAMPSIAMPPGPVGGQSAISTVTPQQRRQVNSGIGPVRHSQASYRYSPLGTSHSAHQDPLALSGFGAAPSTNQDGQNGWCLFVYNIPEDAEDALLYQLFSPLGAVLSVKVIKDYNTQKSRGYGFVTMVNYQEAYNAIVTLNGHMVDNKALQVSFKTAKN